MFSSSLEKYIEIPSDKGIPFNEKPEMKAIAIAEKARDAIISGKWDQVQYLLACCSLMFKEITIFMQCRYKSLLVISESNISIFSLCSEFKIWKVFVAGACELSKWGYGGSHW
jgi:hypothetical protein